MTEWYYKSNSIIRGPVSTKILIDLLDKREIENNARISKDEKMHNSVPLKDFLITLLAEKQNKTPNRTSNFGMWLIVLGSAIIPIIVATAEYSTHVRIPPIVVNSSYILFCLVICKSEKERIKNTPHHPQLPSLWWSLLVPVYMYKRNKILNASQNTFVAIIFIISLYTIVFFMSTFP